MLIYLFKVNRKFKLLSFKLIKTNDENIKFAKIVSNNKYLIKTKN